jgi:hypothetical protein
MDAVTEFLRSYLAPAGTGLADDPGLKASRWSTGGALSVFETTIAEGPPLHVHDREDASVVGAGPRGRPAQIGQLWADVMVFRGPPASHRFNV